MEERIVVAGFGGQGVLLIGQVLCYAGMEEGKNVAWLPSYGPEMRGGTASCSVILSDNEIGTPLVTNPKHCIVMNLPSFHKYEGSVEENGNLFINSSLIEEISQRETITNYLVPCSEAAQKVENLRTANMAMLGSFVETTKIVTKESALKALETIFGERRAHLIPINEQAMQVGFEMTVKK